MEQVGKTAAYPGRPVLLESAIFSAVSESVARMRDLLLEAGDDWSCLL